MKPGLEIRREQSRGSFTLSKCLQFSHPFWRVSDPEVGRTFQKSITWIANSSVWVSLLLTRHCCHYPGSVLRHQQDKALLALQLHELTQCFYPRLSLNQERFFLIQNKTQMRENWRTGVHRASPLPLRELWVLLKICTHPHTPIQQGHGELRVPLFPMPNNADWGPWKKGICPASGLHWVTARFSWAKQLLWWSKAQPVRKQHKDLQVLLNWECQRQETQDH